MPSASAIQPISDSEPARVRARARRLGQDLAATYQQLLDAIPGGPHTPTPLARRLGLSRVTVGRLLIALAKPNPYEFLERVPGPESLRAVARSAASLGAPKSLAERAVEAADSFADLIRHGFGTRGAFNAAITPQRPILKERFAHSSRYQVFMGMRQILGVAADTWLTCMLFAPARGNSERLSVTSIHGALGMLRLRPDVNVYFTAGAPSQPVSQSGGVSGTAIDLSEFCTHEAATLETHEAGGQMFHRLAHNRLGRQAPVDMLAVDHNALGPPRYATPRRPRGGLVVFPDVPVRTLICDALLHDEVFPGTKPELIVYNPGARGPANPADHCRDIDRVALPEKIQALGKAQDRFTVLEVPRYTEMITRVCAQLGHSPDAFRVFRLRMSYPVQAFQIVMAFDAPPPPA